MDEYFERTEGTTSRSFLTDALGSTIGLSDSTGTLRTDYSYEPFGKAISSGGASTNAFQFTGREDDGTVWVPKIDPSSSSGSSRQRRGHAARG